MLAGTMKTDDGMAIKEGCHKQDNVDGVDVEACFCDPYVKDRCNSAKTFQAPAVLLTILVAVVKIVW